MSSRTLGVLVVLSIVFGVALGCTEERGRGGDVKASSSADAGAATGSGGANVEACERYVAAWNQLDCLSGETRIDAATACPATLDDTACDATDYFHCLAESVDCQTVGGVSVPDPQAASQCGTAPCVR